MRNYRFWRVGPVSQGDASRMRIAGTWEFAAVVGPIVLATATFLLACWRLVDLTASDAFTQSERIFWIVLCAAGGWHIVTAGVGRGFRKQSRRRMLLTIASSYAGLVVAFAGTYYVFCAFSDHEQVLEYQAWVKGERLHPEQRRAFDGIKSLWTGADLKPDEYLNAFPRASAKGREKIDSVFEPGNRLQTLLDCLHFSIVTMTTTGYGDISPKQWYSKVVADVQIVTGVTLLVFALGMLFGNWHVRGSLEDERERLHLGEIGFQDSFWRDRLKPYDAVLARRQERATPACPWCGSQHTILFSDRGFRPPGEFRCYEPRKSTIFFIFNLSIATYVVYSFMLPLPGYFAALPLEVQSTILIAPTVIVAMTILVPLSALSGWICRCLQAKLKSDYDDALSKFSNSWSCEACHNMFTYGVGNEGD